MLAVVNLQYTFSGSDTPSQEYLVNHKFTVPGIRPQSSKALVDYIIGYIKEYENPVTSSAQKSKNDAQKLHNITESHASGNPRRPAHV